MRLLVANRGEIALRVIRAASELDNVETVAIITPDDDGALHAASADASTSVGSYLDGAAIIERALRTKCDAIHPGYGFLSESAAFARQCEDSGVTFVGPSSDTIALLGDKVEARALAKSLGVPVAAGSDTPCSDVQAVRVHMATHDIHFPIFLKAVGGGGGRGMRPVHTDADLDAAFASCLREVAAVGLEGGVFVEAMVTNARHVEVQLLGDAYGGLVHLYERECSVQSRRQKVIEMAPAPLLDAATRDVLTSHALRIGQACGYRGAGTCEFLLPAHHEGGGGSAGGGGGTSSRDAPPDPIFLEFNPRIQVEHTVTEEVTGIDLVAAQLQIAQGRSLPSLGITQQTIRLSGAAMQARIQMTAPGGSLTTYAEPGGAGVRVDSALYAGYAPPSTFDPLLLKVISRGSSVEVARRRLLRACGELHLGGTLHTNTASVTAILSSDAFINHEWTTSTLDDDSSGAYDGYGTGDGAVSPAEVTARTTLLQGATGGDELSPSQQPALVPVDLPPPPPGCVYVHAPMPGHVVDASDAASTGSRVTEGGALLVLSSMKMEHVVAAPTAGVVIERLVAAGQRVSAGQPVALLRTTATTITTMSEDDDAGGGGESTRSADGGGVTPEDGSSIRADLARVLAAREAMSDEGRAAEGGGDGKFAERQAARHARGQLTARENVAALLDAGARLFEYGAHAVAAQLGRVKSVDELRRRTPADGLVTGVGSVNAEAFGSAASKVAIAAYDATVLAGTQGFFNHHKLDRLLAVAATQRLPLVLYAEGGGGRPGDTDVDHLVNSALGVSTFSRLAALSGLVPTVGVASGFCFAGNAALLGSCDVVIAACGSNIGMAGPAMIAGGGLGNVAPTAIGPAAEGYENGVVDILVENEAEAAGVARRYLSYFQGRARATGGGDSGGGGSSGSCYEVADQTLLRHAVPENRRRSYAMRSIIETLCDSGSWLELRGGFAKGVLTGLCRIEGRTVGVLANSPEECGGAVDADGALKASRFLELCDAFDVPLLQLIDTPGFLVGVEHEQQAAVRKLARIFSVGASMSVPRLSIITRRAYGLGAMAMMGGHAVGSHSAFHVCWPTAELGPMNLEGAVQLGFSKELASAHDKGGSVAASKLFDKLLAGAVERAGALSVARTLETDDVIDPAESREWITAALDASAAQKGGGAYEPPSWRAAGAARRRPCVSPW